MHNFTDNPTRLTSPRWHHAFSERHVTGQIQFAGRTKKEFTGEDRLFYYYAGLGIGDLVGGIFRLLPEFLEIV
jgi:hypothetical protein